MIASWHRNGTAWHCFGGVSASDGLGAVSVVSPVTKQSTLQATDHGYACHNILTQPESTVILSESGSGRLRASMVGSESRAERWTM